MDSVPSAFAAQGQNISGNLAGYTSSYTRLAVETRQHQGAASGKPEVASATSQADEKQSLRDQPRRYENENLGRRVNISV